MKPKAAQRTRRKRRRPPFTIFATTADMGVRARARSLPKLFEAAALGMFRVIGLSSNAPRRERTVSVRADSLDLLLYAWLSELLYLYDTRGYFVCGLKNTTIVANRIRSRMAYVRADAVRTQRQIKAVTLHGLEIARQRDLYRVSVIFDL